MNIESIVSLSLAGVTFLVSIILIIVGKVKKNKQLEQSGFELLQVFLNVKNAMQNTEIFSKFSLFSSEEKKEYCQNLVKNWCVANKIDPKKYKLGEIIEFFMDVANTINVRTTTDKVSNEEKINII